MQRLSNAQVRFSWGVKGITVVAGACAALSCAPRPGLVAADQLAPKHREAVAEPASTPRREQAVKGLAALSALQAGNIRFVEGHAMHPHADALFRRRLENEQHPLATVLGCSDSRVPPELVFDEGFGDLFVIRVAGNVVDADVVASVEYAVDHLHTPLLVVLGHEGCGAVTAAVEHLRGTPANDSEPQELSSLLGHIEQGLQRFGNHDDLDAVVHHAVEENVRHSMLELAQIPDIRNALARGELHLVGAIYNLHTGRVRFLGPGLAP